MDVKEFKKIDAHAHIGEFGGWAKLSINAEQLIAQMDEFNIEKTLLCSEPNEICLDAVEKYPDRFVGMVYPNPYDGQKAVDMIYDYVQNKGFKGIWKNRMMTFASFCILLVSLLMVGTSVLVSINLTRIIGGIEDKSEVIVIVKDGTSQADMQTLENNLKEVGNINTVSLYSKDEAWKNMLKGMTDEEKDFFQYADDNPLPDTYKVTVKDIEKMSETTTQIETFDNVDSTKSPTAFADILISIRRVFTIVAFAVIVALVVVCLIIISNTTRASVFARRKEINIMKYVGATNSFIRIPFFIEGMIVGLLAAAGALLLTKFAYEGIYNIFNDDFKLWSILGVQNLYSFKSLLLPVAASYLIAGAVIGAVGTSISTGKHLKV